MKKSIVPEVISEKSSGKDLEEGKSKALIPFDRFSEGLSPATDGKPKDPLALYIREINRYPLLSRDEEKALINSLLESGDVEVAKKLVLHNLRLVVKIAMEYRTAWQNVMDLIQEGNIGLMKAVSKYNPEKGAKLSYYSSWWIRSYILKYILDNFRMVKIGTGNDQKKLFYNLMKEKARLESEGVKADSKQLAEHFGVSEKAVVAMEQRLSPEGGEVSIDLPVGSSSEGGASLGELLSDESLGPEDLVSNAQSIELLKDHLKDFIADLKDRDKEVFTKRLLSEVPESLQSIANDYGVSRERIRQIEARLIENLKVYMAEHIR